VREPKLIAVGSYGYLVLDKSGTTHQVLADAAVMDGKQAQGSQEACQHEIPAQGVSAWAQSRVENCLFFENCMNTKVHQCLRA